MTAVASEVGRHILGMSVGEFAIATATLALVAVTLPLAVEAMRRMWLEKEMRSLLLRACSVRDFDPSWIVTAYGVREFLEYWPTPADLVLDQAFSRCENVLLIGRPHVGKSRSAIHHLKKHCGTWWTLSPWRIIQPLPEILDNLPNLRIPRGRYVLLLVDLDVYLKRDASEGGGVLQLVQTLQRQARKLMVVATMRRTRPEFDALANSSNLLGRWNEIEISEWNSASGTKLAEQLGVDYSTWDGTPLSLIQPSSLMAQRYRLAPLEEKKALRMLKLCFESGLFFIPCQPLFALCQTDASDIDKSIQVNEAVLYSLYEKGWIAQPTNRVQSFPALVPIVADWSATPRSRGILKDVLVTGRWHQQLAALGSAYVRASELGLARDAYAEAILVEPTKESYHYRLGVVFLLLHDWRSATASFKRATQLKPAWATAWFRLARALQEAGDVVEGRNAFQRAMALGSTDSVARYRTGELLRLEGRSDEAVAQLQEAVRLDATNSDAWLALGRTLRVLKKWAEAEAAYLAAIRLRPKWAEAYFGIGEPLQKLHRARDAEKAYRMAIELRPDLAEVYTFLTPLLERDGRVDEAEQILERGVQACPNEPRIHSFLGEHLFRKKHDAASSLSHFEEAVRLKPSYVEALVGLAAAQRALANRDSTYLDKALANNKLVLLRDPENENAWLGLGICYVALKDWTSAMGAFREVTRFKPDMAAGWFYRSLALRYAGEDFETAAQFLSTAQKLGFKAERCKIERARLFATHARADEAMAILSELEIERGRALSRSWCKDPAFDSLRDRGQFQQMCSRAK